MILYVQIVVRNLLFMNKVQLEWLDVMKERRPIAQSAIQLLGAKELMVS